MTNEYEAEREERAELEDLVASSDLSGGDRVAIDSRGQLVRLRFDLGEVVGAEEVTYGCAPKPPAIDDSDDFPFD